VTDDPFRTLGVPYDVTPQGIDDAWRNLMRELHPDANPTASEVELRRLTTRAAEVNAAHNRLRNNLAQERLRFGPVAAGSPRPIEPPVLLPVRVPGGELFRRPTTWVVIAVALVVGLLILNKLGSPETPRGPVTSTSLTMSPGWYVGNCVAGDMTVVPVRCSNNHSGRIVAQVGAEQYCPEAADGAVFRNNVYFCIDTDA
jgi:hypothetical protein